MEAMSKHRIGVVPWNPWVMFKDQNISLAYGIVVDLYNSLQRSHIFDYELSFGVTYGSLGKDNKWTGMIGKMINNEIDMGGPFFLDEAKSRVVEYHSPLYFSELVIVTHLTAANKDPFLVFGIYSFLVWMVLLVSAFISASVALLIYTFLPSVTKRSKIEAFLRYLWIFHTSLIGNEFGSKGRWFVRHIFFSASFRSLEAVWFMTCLVFVYTFQGSIISTYTADKLKPRHENLEDLLQDTNIELGTFANSFPYICLSHLANSRFEPIFVRSHRNLLGPKDLIGRQVWLDEIEEGKTAIVSESIYTRFLIGERFKATGKCDIRVTPLGICSTYLALASKKNISNELARKINRGILRFNEAGLATPHMAQSLLFYDICTNKGTRERQPLDITDVFGAFMILCAGLLLSVLNFIVEIILRRNFS